MEQGDAEIQRRNPVMSSDFLARSLSDDHVWVEAGHRVVAIRKPTAGGPPGKVGEALVPAGSHSWAASKMRVDPDT